mgnify:CR=1 FL=1|jgi:hypothetical protein|nr:MAG TPA: hypothetical protein [Crassvirales sp.]
METKINIAAILKGKPKGTKLYSTIHGKCSFEAVTDEIFKINFCTSKFGLTQTGECTLIKFGNMFDNGECVIFPSNEMRDWSKFAWKRGDVLINNAGYKIFFDKWENDDYTRFFGSVKVHCYDTEDYTLASREEAQEFIKSTEKAYGGKLNLETLEIKKKTKFEDGDIAFADYGNRQYVFIVSGETGLSEDYNSSIYLDLSSPTPSTAFRTSFFKKDLCELRLATEEEKKQLFSALEEKGKRWDSDKKAIVDVKPKWTPKPFDKVLVRDSKSSKWRANLFSHKNIDEPYYCVYASWNYCIPYEGNEHLLGTTKNVKE